MPEPIGTTQAHGRTWPLYEREGFQVEVHGIIDADDEHSANAIRDTIRLALEVYQNSDLDVRVVPITRLFMSPEDEAERDALDEKAIAA